MTRAGVREPYIKMQERAHQHFYTLRGSHSTMFEAELRKLLAKHKLDLPLEVPPDRALGDLAMPCFTLAKERKKAPAAIAQEIAKELSDARLPRFVAKVVATGPYVNFFIDTGVQSEALLTRIHEEKDGFGRTDEGKGKTVVIDYSAPNIAKPFHIGHLRSTVIGDALRKLHEAAGYKVIGINHLGDWGTQFGALIYAHRTWGDRQKLKDDPLQYMLDIYVKFHAEAEKDAKLEEEARAWFKKLEDGDGEALKLWAKFKEESLEEFSRIYKLLGVEFESENGESFYNDKIDGAIEAFSKVSETDDGALIVRLEGNIPPLMLRKSNGSSTYAARDAAAALYRLATYKPHRLIYVVGQQGLHFRQVFGGLARIGKDAERFTYVDFGHYHLPEGKMSTRKGRVVFMEDVLNKTVELARETIEKKNPGLKSKDKVARGVGIGAIKFGDLVNDRIKDITFDWDKFLDFEGDTGPYLQYTHARACSILRKAKTKPGASVDFGALTDDKEAKLITLLSRFEEALASSRTALKPHHLAQYLIELARAFNEFYHACPVLSPDTDAKVKAARLLLVSCAAQVLRSGLGMLGIWAPDEM